MPPGCWPSCVSRPRTSALGGSFRPQAPVCRALPCIFSRSRTPSCRPSYRWCRRGRRCPHRRAARRIWPPSAVHAGEVQIDIRHLVALEAEENLEGDIEPFAQAVLAADGAFFRRQVDAAGCQLVLDVEVAPFAFAAAGSAAAAGLLPVMPHIVATNEEPTDPRQPTR